ncbi:MAG: cytidine deaminase [Bacteroidales bacterium]|nr:cytidine deaminase [Bacteroidales bacterium]
MKQQEIKIIYEEYENISELQETDQELLIKAVEISDKAYAPYSDYHVGAAILLGNGKIITGNNQENVAYPSGLCAERVAIYYASSQYPEEEILAIAITANAKNFSIKVPVAPCGACRQVLAEYETRQQNNIRLLLMSQTGKIQIIKSVKDVLPLMFHAEELKKR